MKILSLAVLLIGITFAQTNVDSVFRSIAPLNDSSKVRILMDLCWENRTNHPEEALMFGHTALGIAEKLDRKKNIAELFNYLGVIYSGIGRLDSAYSYHKRSLELSTAMGDSIQIAYAYENLAAYYLKNAFYSSALESVLKSYEIFEKCGFKPGMAYALNDIGEVYFEQADLEKARSYFFRAVALRIELNDVRGHAKTLTNIAAVYEQQKKYQLAIETYEKALKLSREVNYLKGVSKVLSGLAEISYKTGDYKDALERTFASLENDTQIGDKQGELINLNRLGKIYIKMNDLEKAHQYLEKSRQESDASGHLGQLMNAYSLLTDLSLLESDYKSANSYLKEYSLLKEKIFGKESSNKIADLQTAFMTERKDKENDLLKKDIEFQKQTTSYIILILILAFSGAILYYMRFKSQREATRLLRELNESKDRLFSLIGHDLKNPFFAVENLAGILNEEFDELDDVEKRKIAANIQNSAGNISRLLSDLLTWAQTQRGSVSLSKQELDVNEVISGVSKSFEMLAEAKGIKVDIEVPSGLKIVADKMVVETILGNFMNNAIKYSYKDSRIITGANAVEGEVELWVKDFGIGMDRLRKESIMNETNITSFPGTMEEKGTGLGLRIAKELAKIHGGVLTVESSEGKGSRFMITIPVA